MRPLCQRLQHRDFNGDGRTTVRPYKSLHVELYDNGCTDGLRPTERPYTGLLVRLATSRQPSQIVNSSEKRYLC